MSDDNNDPLTVTEFCEREKISRAKLYLMWAAGEGPRYYLIGTHRRISPEARLEWRRGLEAASSKANAA